MVTLRGWVRYKRIYRDLRVCPSPNISLLNSEWCFIFGTVQFACVFLFCICFVCFEIRHIDPLCILKSIICYLEIDMLLSWHLLKSSLWCVEIAASGLRRVPKTNLLLNLSSSEMFVNLKLWTFQDGKLWTFQNDKIWKFQNDDIWKYQNDEILTFQYDKFWKTQNCEIWKSLDDNIWKIKHCKIWKFQYD